MTHNQSFVQPLVFGDFKAVVPVVNRLVEQAHKWEIKSVFVAGSSAQPFAYLFKQLWMRKYKEALPHFLALGESPLGNSAWKNRVAKFGIKNPALMNQPSLILDEYALKGKTIRTVRAEVERTGFSLVKTAVLGISPYTSLKPDFVGTRSKHHYKNEQERKAVEFIGNFAGLRADTIGMARGRKGAEIKHYFGRQLTDGIAYLREVRVKSRKAAAKYKPRK